MVAVGSGIDEDGTVVGSQQLDGWKAIRYSNGRGTELLESLLPSTGEWSLVSGNNIRNGEILGWGLHNSEGRGFRIRTAPSGDVIDISEIEITPQYPPTALNVVSPAHISGAASAGDRPNFEPS